MATLVLRQLAAIIVILGVGGCVTVPLGSLTDRQPIGKTGYPPHWWAPVAEEAAAWWEVLPQAAEPGEVILSKRNELGLLSNFAHTPFVFRGVRYQSLEGFWQMMKYPEGPTDQRATFPGIKWLHTRQAVSRMTGANAKAAGDLASSNMEAMGIAWVTFQGRRMTYRTPERGAQHDLIAAATRAKVDQNTDVRDVLLSTGDLILRPDHHQPPDAPPAWRYHEILMMIRDELQRNPD